MPQQERLLYPSVVGTLSVLRRPDHVVDHPVPALFVLCFLALPLAFARVLCLIRTTSFAAPLPERSPCGGRDLRGTVSGLEQRHPSPRNDAPYHLQGRGGKSNRRSLGFTSFAAL